MARPGAAASRTDPTEFSTNLLRQSFQPAEQILLARHPGDLVAKLAVLEEQQRRNRPNIVFEGETLVLVDVYLRDFDRVRFFACDLVQQRRDHFARTAPFGPKIDDHWLVVLREFTVKI